MGEKNIGEGSYRCALAIAAQLVEINVYFYLKCIPRSISDVQRLSLPSAFRFLSYNSITFHCCFTISVFATVKKLFAQRRKDHVEAVQTLLKMDNYERLYKMIAVLTEKIAEVIESSKSVVERAGFLPHNSSFPEDTNVKEGMIIYPDSRICRKVNFAKCLLLQIFLELKYPLTEYDSRLYRN